MAPRKQRPDPELLCGRRACLSGAVATAVDLVGARRLDDLFCACRGADEFGLRGPDRFPSPGCAFRNQGHQGHGGRQCLDGEPRRARDRRPPTPRNAVALRKHRRNRSLAFGAQPDLSSRARGYAMTRGQRRKDRKAAPQGTGLAFLALAIQALLPFLVAYEIALASTPAYAESAHVICSASAITGPAS